ncbi:hypothetical protein [Actinoplanes sp. N902-109]|uniref:MmyB family transcriptional regulator n=1 Tax=Actinoplanes sp. (strain N902-109) TaxID=649831 RepID=UPI000329569D|nr:hypothetical protein [Actinoplanes sp. N902-109]AGL18630.1 XRE family transcriptional regulator [Actinoplanes sp. N902-109]
MVSSLRRESEEFAGLGEKQEAGLRWSTAKRFAHPEVGRLGLCCQVLLDPDQA